MRYPEFKAKLDLVQLPSSDLPWEVLEGSKKVTSFEPNNLLHLAKYLEETERSVDDEPFLKRHIENYFLKCEERNKKFMDAIKKELDFAIIKFDAWKASGLQIPVNLATAEQENVVEAFFVPYIPQAAAASTDRGAASPAIDAEKYKKFKDALCASENGDDFLSKLTAEYREYRNTNPSKNIFNFFYSRDNLSFVSSFASEFDRTSRVLDSYTMNGLKVANEFIKGFRHSEEADQQEIDRVRSSLEKALEKIVKPDLPAPAKADLPPPAKAPLPQEATARPDDLLEAAEEGEGSELDSTTSSAASADDGNPEPAAPFQYISRGAAAQSNDVPGLGDDDSSLDSTLSSRDGDENPNPALGAQGEDSEFISVHVPDHKPELRDKRQKVFDKFKKLLGKDEGSGKTQ